MAAQNAVFKFRGASGRSYNISAYLDDTATHLVTFDQTEKATASSPDYWQPPEVVVLQDVCIAAASGQTSTQLLVNGMGTGDVLLNAIHLASITNRPGLSIPYSPSNRVGAKQLA